MALILLCFPARVKKPKKLTIFKTLQERLHKIIFNEIEYSLTVIFEHHKKNKCVDTIQFTKDEYTEIRNTLQQFFAKLSVKDNEYVITDAEENTEIEIIQTTY